MSGLHTEVSGLQSEISVLQSMVSGLQSGIRSSISDAIDIRSAVRMPGLQSMKSGRQSIMSMVSGLQSVVSSLRQ